MNPGRILFRHLAVLAISTAVSFAKTTPVSIHQTVDAEFPAALAFSPLTSGEVRVVINVAADGQLADVLVTGYTDKAFVNEARKLLQQWRYSPAAVDGQAVGACLELQLKFTAKGRVISLAPVDTPQAITQRSVPAVLSQRVCTPGELDRPLEAMTVISPTHPGKAESAPPQNGITLLSFFVDETGRTRMPVVVSTTHPAYAEAAVGALSQWRFAVPTRRGEPVSVRVQQQFIFPADPS